MHVCMDFFMGKQLYRTIELIELLDNYRQLVGKHYIIATNDRKLPEVEIIFRETNFPHLIGLQKMASFNKYVASKNSRDIIKAITESDLTMENVIADKSFYQIEPRIKAFYFMLDVFMNFDVTPTFVQIRDVKPQRLNNVDFILYKYIDNGRRMTVAGFSQTNNTWFAPATLHIRKVPNLFTNIRQAQIKKISII